MSKRGEQTLKGALRQIIKDKSGRLHPNKRLLAVMLLAVVEGREEWLELAREEYGTPSRLKTNEPGEKPLLDKDNLETQNILKDAYASILGEENGTDTSNN